MADVVRQKRGFKEVRADRRARRNFLIVAWLLSAALAAFTAFAVYFAVEFANRLFTPAAADPSRITRFNIPDAMKIRRLEHVWTTPSP